MLSVEESKKYLNKFNLTDKQIEQFRNNSYIIVGEILDELYEKETNH